jgi:pimeloyl-ACP methyl ester carboxylesterase
MQPDTRYAKSGDVHIAYQVFGEGPINLVLAPFFVSNVEHFWDEPDISRWLLRLASFARVVMFDKRGTGMSDRVAEMPGLDQRMDDLRAVMEAAGMEQAAILGLSEGGTLAALFAATYPNRCRGLILCGAFARFSSWFPTEEAFAQFLGYIDTAWGSGGGLPFYIPSRVNDPAFQRWFARFERLGASPAAVASYMRMNSQIDISDIVPTIRVPTLVIHRTQDVTINVEAGRYLAEHIPGARYLELPGIDHPPMIGDNANEIADAIQEFLTGARAPVEVDRVLATVLFTDIVGSTEKAAALGDSRWRNLLDKHHATIRSNSLAFVAMRSRRPATVFLPLSMVRLAACVARALLPKRSGHSGSKYVPGSTPASAKSSAMMSAALPSTSVRASLRSPVPARCWCRAPSKTLLPVLACASAIAAAKPSKASPANGVYSQSNGKELDARPLRSAVIEVNPRHLTAKFNIVTPPEA